MTLLDDVIAAAGAATTPEETIRAPMALLQGALGDREAHLRPGALNPGQTQFLVAGGFLVTPDGRHQMLVGNTGFPAEQERLCIPVDGGDPGRVIASAAPLLLHDTRAHGGFRQYLKTARMGSAVYAPLVRDGRAFGLIITAALAGGTMGEDDLAVIAALAPVVAGLWDDRGGPAWLAQEYAGALAGGRAWIATER